MMKKNLGVFFLVILSALFLVATVSAAQIADIQDVEINDVGVNDASIIAGDTLNIVVWFEAFQSASNVKMEVELNGDKVDVDARTALFDIEDGRVYRKTLKLQAPYELKDQVSDSINLRVRIWNEDHETEEEVTLRVQRPSFNIDIKSIDVDSVIQAGKVIPVDVVLRNTGYNDLNDLYVKVSIPALEIQRTSYFGDLIAVECDEDFSEVENYGVNFDENRKCDEGDEDTVRGRIYLTVPYDIKSGLYTLKVKVENNDLVTSKTKQISVQNDFSAGNVIVADSTKNVAVGANAEYFLYIANPTDNLKFYRIVVESPGSVSTNVDQSVVGISAGTSKAIKITANAASQGEYILNVNVFSGENLVDTVTLNLNAEGTSISNPIVVLTVILAIVFVVLLIVLIVLLGKKPEKTEELGESYY